jgi:DNA-binding transcriptional regulator YhcF (GntR family)
MSDLRKILHSAYTFIRSQEINKATASLTLDHLIQEQITRLKKGETRAVLDAKGESMGNRISYLDTLDSLEKELSDVIKAVQNAGNDQDKLAELGLEVLDKETES